MNGCEMMDRVAFVHVDVPGHEDGATSLVPKGEKVKLELTPTRTLKLEP